MGRTTSTTSYIYHILPYYLLHSAIMSVSSVVLWSKWANGNRTPPERKKRSYNCPFRSHLNVFVTKQSKIYQDVEIVEPIDLHRANSCGRPHPHDDGNVLGQCYQ